MQAAFEFQVKADAAGTFEGYGSVFGNVDSARDVVEPGAFTATLARLKAAGRTLPVLWQHAATEPVGVYSTIQEDTRGLFVAGKLASKGKAAEVRELLAMGAVTGLSIGYRVIREAWNNATRTNHLQEVDLREISLVTFGANPEARVTAVKALSTLRDCELCLRDSGMSRSEAQAFIAAVRDVSAGEPDDMTSLLAIISKAAPVALPIIRKN